MTDHQAAPSRLLKLWLIVASGVGLVLAVGAIIFANGPRDTRGSYCPYCGRQRFETWFWRLKQEDRITGHSATGLVEDLLGPCRPHRWISTSEEHYGWFNDRFAACGGPHESDPLTLILKVEHDEQLAKKLLTRYHGLLASGAGEAAWSRFSEEVRAAWPAAIAEKPD